MGAQHTSHTVKTPIEVTEGTWRGHVIRRARKAGRCDYHPGHRKCRIEVGDLYLEGERNDEAGGYGTDRYCMTCASECEAVVAAIAKATGGAA